VALIKEGFTESFIEAAGGKIHVLKGGSGSPMLVLHHDVGNPGWLPFYADLARDFTVLVPSHPGFGKSDRPEWMRTVRDMAMVYQWALDELKLDCVSVIGLGFGGWIAAEIALMCPHRFDRMVLVNAMGIQPRKGDILDQFIINNIEYVAAGFADAAALKDLYGDPPSLDQLVEWEVNREMTTRIAWKPYMFDQAMPHLARGIKTPTLLVWGEQDRIVPFDCAERYAEAMPNARIARVAGAGHFIEVERPVELARLARDFIKRR
jgi:pimeloyl-ACP methyl ester carboxylesterase